MQLGKLFKRRAIKSLRTATGALEICFSSQCAHWELKQNLKVMGFPARTYRCKADFQSLYFSVMITRR